MEEAASLNELVVKFWELESIATKPILSAEEQLCENHFQLNTKRDHTGRYIVKLPFKRDPADVEETVYAALHQFNSLQRRLQHNGDLRQSYEDYMAGYLDAGHISRAPLRTKADPIFYLPHHGVLKEESTTTKLRVVFNGSLKSSTGLSLNDILMTGPWYKIHCTPLF